MAIIIIIITLAILSVLLIEKPIEMNPSRNTEVFRNIPRREVNLK